VFFENAFSDSELEERPAQGGDAAPTSDKKAGCFNKHAWRAICVLEEMVPTQPECAPWIGVIKRMYGL
jgi:hypothetical protein